MDHGREMPSIEPTRIVGNFFFFRGGVCRSFRKMVNIFAYTCPNRSGVGAINNPDRSEQVFDVYYISEVSKKNFHGQHFDGPSLENVSFWWF